LLKTVKACEIWGRPGRDISSINTQFTTGELRLSELGLQGKIMRPTEEETEGKNYQSFATKPK